MVHPNFCCECLHFTAVKGIPRFVVMVIDNIYVSIRLHLFNQGSQEDMKDLSSTFKWVSNQGFIKAPSARVKSTRVFCDVHVLMASPFHFAT